MKKAIALLGTIVIICSLVPMGAIADSSVALPQFVFSLMFQSVSTPSFVDVTNYNAYSDTTTSSSTVSLANSVGSYSQINRTGIPVAQNLICVKFSIVSPSAHFFDDITIEPYINGSPAHLYGTYTQSDYNNQIDYYMFFYIGEDSHRVKDGAGQDITPWGIRITTNAVRNYAWNYSSSTTHFYYYNYTLQSQTVDPGEAADLALNIINVLQLSQLSENLGMINTQLDTGNIASMMESMLTYIAQIPDIISYIDQLETTDINILSAVNTFINYYESQLDYTFTTYNVNNNRYSYANNTFSRLNNSNIDLQEYYLKFQIPSNINKDGIFNFRFRIAKNTAANANISFNAQYAFINTDPINFTSSQSWYLQFDQCNDIHNITAYRYDQGYRFAVCYFSIPYTYLNNWQQIDSDNYILIHLTFTSTTTAYSGESFSYYFKPYNNFQWNVIYYLKQLLYGSHSNVPSDVQQTTDEINQNAQAVNNFQSSMQQSLDQNLQNVPVADYQIQATTGTQYMKAYSETLFNASNGFRIWFMLPLILFLIGMLIRWGIKK